MYTSRITITYLTFQQRQEPVRTISTTSPNTNPPRKMADANSEPSNPNPGPTPPPSTPTSFSHLNKAYKDSDLHLICCCALYSPYQPSQLAQFFRGELPTTTPHLHLHDVPTEHICDVFFKMREEGHPIYEKWAYPQQNPDIDIEFIEETVKPLVDAGLRYFYQDRWGRDGQVMEPFWVEGG